MPSENELVIDALIISIRESSVENLEDLLRSIPGYLTVFKDEIKELRAERVQYTKEIIALKTKIARMEAAKSKSEPEGNNLIQLVG